MKKLICLSSLLFSASMLFTGCSNEIPAMSQGEQEAVVEYAANIVLKYDKRQAARLKEVEEVELSGLQEDAPPDAAATPEASTMEPDPEVEIVDPFGESQDSGPSELPLEDFLQVENVTFTYGGYEIADSYPEAGEGVYFTMNATPGISLLVMKFTAQNTGTETEEVDLLSLGARYKVTVNGETKNALSTMLLNDLASYKGTLEAGESAELVVVTEIPGEQASAVDSVSLIAKNADTTSAISIN